MTEEGTDVPGGKRTWLMMFRGLLTPLIMGFGSWMTFISDLRYQKNIPENLEKKGVNLQLNLADFHSPC